MTIEYRPTWRCKLHNHLLFGSESCPDCVLEGKNKYKNVAIPEQIANWAGDPTLTIPLGERVTLNHLGVEWINKATHDTLDKRFDELRDRYVNNVFDTAEIKGVLEKLIKGVKSIKASQFTTIDIEEFCDELLGGKDE